jgi:luciferase family oxidoreductase group 1
VKWFASSDCLPYGQASSERRKGGQVSSTCLLQESRPSTWAIGSYIAIMTLLSVLDLSPVPEGSSAGDALRNSADLAHHVEALGYRRFWMAEHHNMPGIASAATAVALAHVATHTSTIRLGAGGIMLPNHAPLIIAEQFGTLAALHPGRIDLGLGRAPGTDQNTMRALRRNLGTGPDEFPRDVVELMEYFKPAAPGQAIQAVPGAGLDIEFWILGSSTYGAQLAAMLGLPYAFASHFAPAQMTEAAEIYRERFKPVGRLQKPYLMLGCGVFAAETDAEARLLFSSQQQAFVNLRTGRPGKLPRPLEGYEASLDPYAQRVLQSSLSCSFVGSRETVRRELADFIERTGADELMVTAQIHDPEARKRSFTMLSEIHAEMGAVPAGA